ncbi:MAG: hypothetical protein Q9186_006616 [Xanthomendoza sp. 1 TL-2023]
MSQSAILAEAAGPPLNETPRTLRDLLQRTVAASPSNRAVLSLYQDPARFPAASNTGDANSFLVWTYEELVEKANRLARSLSAQGIRQGMRLAVFLPNGAEWALLFWASIKLGTIFVSLDERAMPRRDEIHHYLDIVKPSALFVSTASNARTLVEQNPSDVNSIMFKATTNSTGSTMNGWENLEDLLSNQKKPDASARGLSESNEAEFIPTMLLALLKQPTFHPERTRSLQVVNLGGTIIPPSIAAAATDTAQLGATEAVVRFGMTEGLPVCCSSSQRGLKSEHGAVSLGQPLPGVTVRICESQTRRVLNRGEFGELHFGGGLVIGGYLYGDNQCFYDDQLGHWIASGDEAMMDEQGHIFIFGRYKDIIIRGGENLSPGLIENCLGRAGIQGQIIGVPDDIAGEVPLAVVQVAHNAPIPRADIRVLILESLGRSCLPTAYLTLAELGMTSFPLTTSGKVRKTELKKAVLDYLSQRAPTEDTSTINAIETKDTEAILSNILMSLIGQSEQSVPRDQPISTMLDSINLLRFQATVQKITSKKIDMDAPLGDFTIAAVAMQLDTQATQSLPVPEQRRQGPPTASDMIHTHGDESCALRTRAQVEQLVSKYDMTWEDTEDVYPMPSLYGERFENQRPISNTIRSVYMIQHSSPSVVRSALERSLNKWSILRSLAIKFDNTALFVIMRASKMYRASILDVPVPESQEELQDLWFPNPSDNSVALNKGCPLARFAITSVKGSDATGLMMLANHATFDAISQSAFKVDLETNLRNDEATVSNLHTDYKLFASAFYLYSGSIPAQLSVAYHVNRLRRIGSHRESLWPPQRCPGWFIGDDTGYSFPPGRWSPLLQERSQVDADGGGHAAMLGLRRIVELDDFANMRSRHNISAPTLFKAACAVLNSRMAGEQEVCFANSQAGRQWPFLDEATAKFLPNPITIAGATIDIVINRISVDPNTSVGSLLTHLEEEQYDLTKHAHAPTAAIAAQLGPADAATFSGARRQLLNWNPVMPSYVGPGFAEGERKMERLSIEGHMDLMLVWHCGMVGTRAVLITQWDGAQFGRKTVEGWVDGFMEALKWLAMEENWGQRIGDLHLDV